MYEALVESSGQCLCFLTAHGWVSPFPNHKLPDAQSCLTKTSSSPEILRYLPTSPPPLCMSCTAAAARRLYWLILRSPRRLYWLILRSPSGRLPPLPAGGGSGGGAPCPLPLALPLPSRHLTAIAPHPPLKARGSSSCRTVSPAAICCVLAASDSLRRRPHKLHRNSPPANRGVVRRWRVGAGAVRQHRVSIRCAACCLHRVLLNSALA